MTGMNKAAPDPRFWAAEVITFLLDTIPGSVDNDEEFDHRFVSAYQMGCEALSALGQAEETHHGARLLAAAQTPGIWPRWDDICVVILKLAQQPDLLSCRMADGRENPSHIVWFGRDNKWVPPPNICPAHSLGWAYAAPNLLPALKALALLEAGRWTNRAETVFWRVQPEDWPMAVSGHHRFLAAVDHAVRTIPGDVRADIEELVTITDKDVFDSLTRRTTSPCDQPGGAPPLLTEQVTPESVRRSIALFRRVALDWLFFTRWRMPEGWLGPKERTRALEIFHDALAISTRRAVLARLWPHAPRMAE